MSIGDLDMSLEWKAVHRLAIKALKGCEQQVLTLHGAIRTGGRGADAKPLFCPAQLNAGAQVKDGPGN